MSLNTVVNLAITLASRAPTQAGFGTPLLVGYHEAWLEDRVREYSEASEMLDDGFDTDHYLYQAALIAKSQDPAPERIKIGRREAALTQVVALTPTNTTEGFAYKGTIGGKALNVVVEDGDTLPDIATAIAAAINALDVGVTAAVDTAASVTGTETEPFALAHGDTLLVAIDADVPGSPDTATFNATAAARESAAETFNLDDLMTLTVRIDGGAVQTITFLTANFVDINAATAEEVAAVINAGILGANATVTSAGTKVTITSDKKGTDSGVNVTGGTANAVLTFTTGNIAGTGNVADIDAVTIAEAKTIIEAAVSGCTVSDDGTGKLKISSDTTGTSSKVLVAAGSTADDEFGLDNATHTGTSGGETVTCTTDEAGDVVSYDFIANPPRSAALEIEDLTSDSTTGDELADLESEDSDFYGVLICDSFSKQTAIETAGWMESVRRIALVQTADSKVGDPNEEEDTMSALGAAEYERTGAIYHRAIGGVEWLAVGLLSQHLTTTPGSATMAHKGVSGVKKDQLSGGFETAITDKNGSYYIDLAGNGDAFEGKSGSGEFLDTTRFIDWLYARIQERVIFVLQNNPKIPYTDAGVDILKGAILAVLQQGIAAGGLAAEPAPTVTAPLVASVDPAERINRRLPDVKFQAQLAGAIHRVIIRGTISV